MATLFLLLSVAYLCASVALGGYSLLGLCVRPLAATRSYAAGLLILISLFLLCTVAVNGLFGVGILRSSDPGDWFRLSTLRGASETIPLSLAALLPCCLCLPAVRRRLAAVFGVACVCTFCYGRVCLLVSAGA